MTQDKTKYTVFTYIFLMFTIVIVFFVSMNLYNNYNQITYNKATLEQTLEDKKQQYTNLSSIKTKLEKSDQKEMQKFLINFTEDEFTSYFYNYAENNKDTTVINSINLVEGQKNDFGFKEGIINLNVSFDSEESMIKMLNFIINSDKYNFYIHSFSYDFGSKGPRNISIPIKVLYK